MSPWSSSAARPSSFFGLAAPQPLAAARPPAPRIRHLRCDTASAGCRLPCLACIWRRVTRTCLASLAPAVRLALEAASPSDLPGFCRKASRSRLRLRFPVGCARRDEWAAQELARCPVTRWIPLAARVTPRGMAECGGLTVTNRVAVQRAYGLGGTRGASGAEKASEKKSPPVLERSENFFTQRFQGLRDKRGRRLLLTFHEFLPILCLTLGKRRKT